MSAWLTAAVASAFAQIPAADLARPPSSARHFIIQSTGGKHGDSWSWVAPDGTRMAPREHEPARSGVRARLERQGGNRRHARGARHPRRDAARATRQRPSSSAAGRPPGRVPIDAGTAATQRSAFYVSQGGPIDTTAWFLEALLARPDKSLDLLPGGKARAAKLADLGWALVRPRQTIALWAVTGIGTSPLPMWADANNKFFALALGIAWLPEAYAGRTVDHRGGAGEGDGGAGSRVWRSRW